MTNDQWSMINPSRLISGVGGAMRPIMTGDDRDTVKPFKPATHGEWQTGRFTEGGRFKNQYRTL